MHVRYLLKYKEIKIEEQKITLLVALYFPNTIALSRHSPCRAAVPNLFSTCITPGSLFP